MLPNFDKKFVRDFNRLSNTSM